MTDYQVTATQVVVQTQTNSRTTCVYGCDRVRFAFTNYELRTQI
ncbi:MAG: hypothetical protein V7K50_19785 [Nostoc sp.]